MIEEEIYLDKDRISVFIGKQGKFKKEFEEKFKCEINVDSETGKVYARSEDGANLFFLEQAVIAVNNFHNPKNALLLESEHMVLENIDVRRLVKNSKRVPTILGRIIGKAGSVRKIIEETSDCFVSIKEPIISVIGPYENVEVVREALKMLILGSSHRSFYNFLERETKMKETRLL